MNQTKLNQESSTNWLKDLLQAYQGKDFLNLILLLTLILLMLRPLSVWYVETPMIVLGVCGIIYRPLRNEPLYWFIIMVFFLSGCYFSKLIIDNHKYLTIYWCMAIFVALLAEKPLELLAKNARLLIGLTFLFAVFWKVINQDFIDSRFFHYELLTDGRFKGFSRIVGGMTSEQVQLNKLALKGLFEFNSISSEVTLLDNARIRIIAKAMTVWTLIIESLVAISFLSPRRFFISSWRDLILITFVVSTYSIASVIGFGWLLVIMGLCQAETKYKWMPLVYIGSFLILQIYILSWSDLFL